MPRLSSTPRRGMACLWPSCSKSLTTRLCPVAVSTGWFSTVWARAALAIISRPANTEPSPLLAIPRHSNIRFSLRHGRDRALATHLSARGTPGLHQEHHESALADLHDVPHRAKGRVRHGGTPGVRPEVGARERDLRQLNLLLDGEFGEADAQPVFPRKANDSWEGPFFFTSVK